jgi:DNA adenine methylase
LACLFLNRTSFSGILSPTAGPIGGQSQNGKYLIDCRFPVDTLVKRVRQAATLADRVRFVHWGSWEETVAKADRLGLDRGQVFYYLDPPFYKKSDRLYAHVFGPKDHRQLRDGVVKIKQHWLLSYDPAPAIVDMYSHNGEGPRRVDLLYSASRGGSVIKAQELIATNLRHLPEETRLWRSSAEWSTPSTCPPAEKKGSRASERRELCG